MRGGITGGRKTNPDIVRCKKYNNGYGSDRDGVSGDVHV
jgi:hypothetical protein